MTQDFKTKLQELIDEAAWDVCEHDHDRDSKSIKQGAAFLMPMIERLVGQRDIYAALLETTQNQLLKHDNELLNLLKGEK